MKVTYCPSGAPAEPRTCSVHTASYSISPPDTPRHFVQRTEQPYRFGAHFRDEAGQPVCDRCVAQGLIDGAIDLTNPDELRSSVPQTIEGLELVHHEAPAVAAAREALDHWGLGPLGVLERAVEAAERHGRLEDLAARLFAALPAIRHESDEIEAPAGASMRSASHPPEVAGTVTPVAEGAVGEPTNRDPARSPTGTLSRRRWAR